MTWRILLLSYWQSRTKTWEVPLQTNYPLGCFRSKISTCLLVTDPRSQHAVRLPHKLPGMHYSANEQCQILFGTNATFCRNMEVSCLGRGGLAWAGASGFCWIQVFTLHTHIYTCICIHACTEHPVWVTHAHTHTILHRSFARWWFRVMADTKSLIFCFVLLFNREVFLSL